MQKKFRVKKDYSYVNQASKVYPAGSELTLDAVDDFVKKQLWKLEVVGETEHVSVDPPKQDAVVQLEAQDLVNSLAVLKEDEPPKVIVDPDAVKPGEGVAKEEAETMLTRVEAFINEQKEAHEEKKKDKK